MFNGHRGQAGLYVTSHVEEELINVQKHVQIQL
jgi:hypothetical protein